MLVMGVGVRPEGRKLPRRIKIGLATAALAAFVIAVPLVEHTRRSIHDAVDEGDAENLAADWLSETELTLGEVTVTDTDKIDVEVFGSKRPPPTDDLARQIADEFDEEIEITVRWTPVEVSVVKASP